MRINRPWRVIAGAGTAAAVVGLGATGAAAAGDQLDLRDRGNPAPVENVQLDTGDESPESADSPAESPFDSADSPAESGDPADPADSPPDPADPADPADSPDTASATSAASADSPDAAGSSD